MRQIEVLGLSELLKSLNDLPLKLEKNILRGALRAGGNVMKSEAKARVPVKSGALRDSIKVSTGIRGGKIFSHIKAGNRMVGGSQAGKTGADRGAFYAPMVEYGTAPHIIDSPKGMVIGGKVRKVVHHPGAPAHPFMRPALYGKADDSVDEVGKYIGERLDKLDEKTE